MQIECPRRKRLDKLRSDTPSSRADIVSNNTRDLHQHRPIIQTINETVDRQEDNPRTKNENTIQNTGGQEQGMDETDTERVSQITTERPQTPDKEDQAMDTQEPPTGHTG